jgi:delta 1-pyrroline-5-carboxylate dehydrogenase
MGVNMKRFISLILMMLALVGGAFGGGGLEGEAAKGGGEKGAEKVEKSAEKAEKGKKALKVADLDGMRKWLRGLTEEQRARVFENLQKWSEMSLDQQQALRNREEVFRKRVQEEIAQACEGLSLSVEDQKAFARRYMEERKVVEAGIRKDMEERRKGDLLGLKSKLQEEFRGRVRN